MIKGCIAGLNNIYSWEVVSNNNRNVVDLLTHLLKMQSKDNPYPSLVSYLFGCYSTSNIWEWVNISKAVDGFSKCWHPKTPF